MQIRKVSNFLLQHYPLDAAEVWDPAGFSVKFNLSEKIKGVVTAIDLTWEVLQLAIDKDANLIVLHHPFKFAQTWQDEFIAAPYKREILAILKKKRINVLALHTNYDNNVNGTSHQIALRLNLTPSIYNPNNPYPCIVKESISINELKSLFIEKMNLHSMRTNTDDLNTKLKNVAILSGSGPATLAYELSQNNTELVILSDVKWNEWVLYQQHKIKILEVSHLDEQVFVFDIAAKLEQNFPDLNVHTYIFKEPYKNI
ncbi:Nif3-like dinuclear metal center hexameric protein [Mycoplasma sp. HS2188]|uniref:Nif3-like dinuclear metal center hexameric protein n=1 Tax=Mycoplasma sp. HS2188 TaxID=2976765 RepID=UPI0021AAF84A|nr:Nif3-like dinuclear metal center hexameric protein [Mycoplasma sp. HS2188]MCT4469391.1 Nif3-like dinuclear metal center hexameric protein [Mycoplasma sp. HS2188]